MICWRPSGTSLGEPADRLNLPLYLPVRHQDPHRRDTLRVSLQEHPKVGPVHPVAELDEAEISRGELGLTPDGDPGYPLVRRRELKSMNQALERERGDGDELQHS